MRALYAGLKLNAALTGTGFSRRLANWLDWVRHSASMCTLRDPAGCSRLSAKKIHGISERFSSGKPGLTVASSTFRVREG